MVSQFIAPPSRLHPYLALGSTITTTTKLVTISNPATAATRAMLPLLAGNLPFVTQCCASKYRWNPIRRTTIEIPKKAAPSGLPRLRKCIAEAVGSGVVPAGAEMVVLRRKSCVIAMPIDANAREVRSHARKVRSVCELAYVPNNP
jgi:hypothetical protein